MSAAAAPEATPTEILEEEGTIFARYLLGREGTTVQAGILDRYARACGRLFADTADAADLSVVAFTRHHPWSLPLLDGACGLVRPGSLLRGKLILMLAILEASPDHCAAFIPAPRSWPAAVARLAALGLLGALKASLGILLLPVARASR